MAILAGMRIHPVIVTTLALTLAAGSAASADSAWPLVPRSVLFGNPEKAAPTLSPEGSRIAYLASDESGVLQVWIGSAELKEALPVTHDPHRGVGLYAWAADGKHILYSQDSDGDETFHIYSVDLETKVVRDLTPFQGVGAQNLMVSAARPNEILVGLNLRKRDAFDLYRIDLTSGAVRLDTENPGDVLSFTADPDFVIRAATAFDPVTAETILRVRDAADAPWRDLVVWPFEKGTMYGQVNGGSVVIDFAPDGRSLYLASARDSETQRCERVDATTGRTLEVVAEDPRADVAAAFPNGNDMAPWAMVDPATHQLEAVAFEYGLPEWHFVDPAARDDFAVLAREHRGVLQVVSRTRDNRRWIVQQIVDDGPIRYLLYDRATRAARLLFEDRPELTKYPLGKTEVVTIEARDRLKLPAYLTLPPGGARKNLPLILYPHGGPWMRDAWGFDPTVQILATRGYAVLQVQFRGSIGFGTTFLNAGTHQFGLAMEDDLIDGVRWAIKEGIADPKRLGVTGASAGGYATLRAIEVHPDLFAAAVDLVGPSDLKLLFTTMPAGWGAVKTRWVRRMGDVEHDDVLNQKLSPLYHVEQIKTPLMIGQGANDPRVKIANSDRIVAAMREENLPVIYLVYPDEGHGFARPENNLDFFGRVEEFFAQHLGGRAEPWVKIEGATGEER